MTLRVAAECVLCEMANLRLGFFPRLEVAPGRDIFGEHFAIQAAAARGEKKGRLLAESDRATEQLGQATSAARCWRNGTVQLMER